MLTASLHGIVREFHHRPNRPRGHQPDGMTHWVYPARWRTIHGFDALLVLT
jgi:hypothetical protein